MSLSSPSPELGPGRKDWPRASASPECAHCGLPVPSALFRPQEEENFCCAGCETVFRLLKGAGLTQYYEFRQRLGEQGVPVESRDQALYEFDSPSFQKLYCKPTEKGRLETELLLEGVHCAACVWLVERLPRLEPAVSSARLDISRAVVALEWNPSEASLGSIARTLSKMGYRPRPSRGQEAERMRRAELRSLLIRIGVAGATAGNVMLMAFALYSGAVGIEEAHTMDRTTTRFFQLASMVVSLPALFAGGLFFRGAWASLRTRTPHMDLPIALGILVAFAWGSLNAVLGRGEIYFDSITALVFFLLIGRYLQRRHQMAQSDAIELLDAVVPGTATIVDGEETRREIPSAEVEPGMRVVVQSGQVVPVDGTIISGSSSLDKSLLSGESRPIFAGPTDSVEAGTLNLGSKLIVRADRCGEDTRVYALLRQVEQALSSRTPLIHQADRLAGVFTLSVLAMAAGVGLYFGLQSPALGVSRALTLLIVACPCALGLATPLTLSAAIHRAAKRKQLVFSPAALEYLATRTDLVLDKTGTLTEGALHVLSCEGDRSLLPAVAAIESDAAHPVGRALCEYAARNSDFESVSVTDIQETLGKGLRGSYGAHSLVVGAVGFVTAQASWGRVSREMVEQGPPGASPVLVAWGGEVRTVLWIGDRLREDAAESLSTLKRQGHRLHLLSGDHPKTVSTVAEELCRLTGDPQLFDSVAGGVDPSEKLAYVRGLRQPGKDAPRPVIMVGDGVNDSGALAAADVGVAVQGAAEASKMSADVYLSQSGVSEVVELFLGAKRTLATITRGIGFSLVYNVVGILGAALGALGPLGAAILMPLSSLTVVTNAYRSRTFQTPEGRGESS